MTLTRSPLARRLIFLGFTDGGAPVTADGDFTPGQFVLAPEGLWLCVEGGSPGSWLLIGKSGPSASTITAVGDTIAKSGRLVTVNNTSGSSKTLTSAPTIADGYDGQRLTVLNVGADNVVVQDQGSLALSNLRLGAATRTLGPRDSLELIYSVDIGDWCELLFSNVV